MPVNRTRSMYQRSGHPGSHNSHLDNPHPTQLEATWAPGQLNSRCTRNLRVHYLLPKEHKAESGREVSISARGDINVRTKQNGSVATTEKNMAEISKAANQFKLKDKPQAMSEDEDKTYGAHQELRTILTPPLTNRKSPTARSGCSKTTAAKALVCVTPDLLLGRNSILPHPNFENAFIDISGLEYCVDSWRIYANPEHKVKLYTNPLIGNYIVIN